MTNLITEARELCEKWSLSDYAVFECEDCIANMVIYKVVELCDALEKAHEQNKQLARELSALARESVERDKALAMMEAEVEAALREKLERSKGCPVCDGKYADERVSDRYCNCCGKRLEVEQDG